MNWIKILVFALLIGFAANAAAWAQTTDGNVTFVPGKYCCKLPTVGNVCVVFKADGSYSATGRLSQKDGTSQGTWKREGTKIILKPKEETGCLVGYLTRFSIDDRQEGSLIWLPKSPQNFARSGGAIVYPRYTRTEAKGN